MPSAQETSPSHAGVDGYIGSRSCENWGFVQAQFRFSAGRRRSVSIWLKLMTVSIALDIDLLASDA